MKPGRKKVTTNEAVSRKPEPEEADSKKSDGDASGTFRLERDMIGCNPDGIDFIKIIQIGLGALCAAYVVWLILHFGLHII